MGNVTMEATQIHDRTEAGKHQSVAEHLKALDALAQQIEDMPAYTSSDRAWLDEWESKLPELPADPETDGVKVLTATTTSGETVKSWEDPESGGGVDYSTTEQNTGKKWIGGSDIYQITYDFGEDIELASNTWYITALSAASIAIVIDVKASNANGAFFPVGVTADTTYLQLISFRSSSTTVRYLTIQYTKTA